jgi:hypothetical protein
MGMNTMVRGTEAMAAGVFCVLLMSACTEPAAIGSNLGNGGAGGQAGSSTSHGNPSGAGGTGGSDASVLTIKLDVPPAWYGELDAPKEPDLPSAPTEDAHCGLTSSSTSRQRVDVLLVLDRSASMDYSITEDCYCVRSASTPGTVCTDTTNCTTRWDAIKPAMTTTLSETQYVNWGLKFFASPNSSNCVVTNAIEVAVAEDSAAKVQTQINSATLSLSTPTAAGINAATAYLKTLTDSNKKFILLATDGEPNCGGTPANINTIDLTGANNAAAAAFAAGFPVYVIGIGPDLSNLTQTAKAGGTTDYYPVTSPKQLADALSSISKFVGSCSFKAEEVPDDPNNIAVYVNKQLVAKDSNEGWTFGATNQDIELKGSYCDQITTGQETTVQILLGCSGAPPFPTFVP